MMKPEEIKGRDGGRVRLQLHDSQSCFLSYAASGIFITASPDFTVFFFLPRVIALFFLIHNPIVVP